MTDFAAELDALEARADDAETDEAWRSLERDLAILDGALVDTRAEARRALDDAEAAASKLGVLGRLNPFDDRRRENAERRDDAQSRLDGIGAHRGRVERLRDRLAAFEAEPFLRALLLKADKIQRGVAADWPAKAAAVALAIQEDLDADAAIDRARGLLERPLAEDPRVFLAAARGRSVADAESFLKRCERTDPRLAAAFLLGAREVSDAADLVRDVELPADVLPAAVAADADRATLEARHYAFADRSAVVRGVVLLVSTPLDDVFAALGARAALDDDVAAFSLLSKRSVEDAERCAQRIRATVRGDAEAEARIRRAAVASDRTPAACAAIVAALQQRFSGSWSSESWIIAAALEAGVAPSARRTAQLVL